MSLQTLLERDPDHLGRRLSGVYTRWTIWYFLGMLLFGIVGIEAIYRAPTPFYAALYPAFKVVDVPLAAVTAITAAFFLGRRLLFPNRPWSVLRALFHGIILVFLAALTVLAGAARAYEHVATPRQILASDWSLIRWHWLAIATFTGAIVALGKFLARAHWFDAPLSPRATKRLIAAMVLFAFAFSGAIAMLRNGPDGISNAYSRYQAEYIGDIGKTATIHDFFHDYVKIHPYLSMHARVHPPGPVVLLWILSWGVGQGPMPLSLATMFFGSLGIIPLFLWARDLTNPRIALTCCLVYVLIPSIVLFTATSADILFTPFTLFTLWAFGRAIERCSIRYALAAGALYAADSLISFSLIGLGAYFAFYGLWKLARSERRRAVFQTAIVMVLAFLAVHAAVWLWSGFNMIACFRVSQAQFYSDQAALDAAAPRYPFWIWKLLNPLCWLYFAGIPVSVLFFSRLRRPQPSARPLFIVFTLTFVALDFLYLARGEGERSAMYVFPFLALPAAHLLDEFGARVRSLGPLLATLAFLAFQCWLTESYFYTYW